MNASQNNTLVSSAWPHRLAVLLVCATFPLLFVGGLVTTTKAGMAVYDWPNTFGYNLFLYPWTTWLSGPWDIFVEHGHRLFASLVGLITIALVIVVWRSEPRAWVRWLSIAALVGVIGQGVLGGTRVLLNEQTFAMIHGCFGPAFFALTVALAVFTSRRWQSDATPRLDAHAGSLHRLAIVTMTLVYVQLILGAYLRHMPVEARPDTFRTAVLMHLVMAAVVVVHIIMLTWLAVRHFRHEPAISRPALIIGGLVLGQLALGGWTWILKYNWPAWFARYDWAADGVVEPQSWLATTITTAHVAMGSLILGLSLAVALRSLRLVRAQPRAITRPIGHRLEVAS